MEYVCIAEQGGHKVGDAVEAPDGAAVSPLHFALPGSPEAAAAEAGRGAVSPPEPPESPAAASPAPSVPVLAPPSAEGSNL